MSITSDTPETIVVDVDMDEIGSTSSRTNASSSSFKDESLLVSTRNFCKPQAELKKSKRNDSYGIVDCIRLLKTMLNKMGLMYTQIIKEETEIEKMRQQNEALYV